MKLYVDFGDFKPWAGAIDTWKKIEEVGKIGELETYLDEIYPEGMTETQLNDLLWMEPEIVFEWLGIETEDEGEEDNNIDTFDSFCSHFTTCANCPLRHSSECKDEYIKNTEKYQAMIDSCPHDKILSDIL